MTFIWFLQNMPEIYKDTYKIGHLASYIHHRFTGEWMVDLVNASMMGLYDTIHQSGWSQELIETFGFEKRIFPEIYNPGTQLGTLLPEMAQKLGLRAGIPVAVGTNDMAAANVGALNTRAGEIMNAAGSSEMVSVLVDRPVPNPEYYLRNTAIPGIWQVYATTAGGSLFSGNSQNGSQRVSCVPAASARIITSVSNPVKCNLDASPPVKPPKSAP